MEIKGKVISFGPLIEGQSARGVWRKQEFIIETIEQYPKQVCLTCWGDTIDAVVNLKAGDTISAGINIESREFNGKWYTDVRAYNIGLITLQKLTSSAPQATQQRNNQQTAQPAQPAQQERQQFNVMDYFQHDNVGDELPF